MPNAEAKALPREMDEYGRYTLYFACPTLGCKVQHVEVVTYEPPGFAFLCPLCLERMEEE